MGFSYWGVVMLLERRGGMAGWGWGVLLVGFLNYFGNVAKIVDCWARRE